MISIPSSPFSPNFCWRTLTLSLCHSSGSRSIVDGFGVSVLLTNNFFEFPDTVGNLVEPALLLQPTVKAPTAAILEPLMNFLRLIIVLSLPQLNKIVNLNNS